MFNKFYTSLSSQPRARYRVTDSNILSIYHRHLTNRVPLTEHDNYDTEYYTKILKNLKLSDKTSTMIESLNSVSEDTIINCFKRAFKNWSNDITELITANEIKIDVQKEVDFDS
ncbi:hypothetical protein DMUE_0060 [Dictyocoela muelleri]|nr:hypothetical protein DMUE_0060 [Dictyocoela muelleri]